MVEFAGLLARESVLTNHYKARTVALMLGRYSPAVFRTLIPGSRSSLSRNLYTNSVCHWLLVTNHLSLIRKSDCFL